MTGSRETKLTRAEKKRAVTYKGDARQSLVYGISDDLMLRVMGAGAENGVTCRAFMYHGVNYGLDAQKAALREAMKQEPYRILVSAPNSVSADVFFCQVALAQEKSGKRCRRLSDFYLCSLSYEELERVVDGYDVIFVGILGPGREATSRLLRLLADSGISVVAAFRSRYEDKYEKANVLADHNPFEIDRDWLQYGAWDASVFINGVYMSNASVCRSTQTGAPLKTEDDSGKSA